MSNERASTRFISDEEFWRQLSLLRRSRRFLIREGVPPNAAGADTPFSFGQLNVIKYRPYFPFGRRSPVTLDDWLLLEEKQDRLQRLFTIELQHRFRLYSSHLIITYSPVLLILLALFSLLMSIFPPYLQGAPEVFGPTASLFCGYLIWTSCLGGLGAIGFLAVNSLAIQDDVTFDISNESLVVMRIVLGALFGCIVSLPFGFQYFKDFANWIVKGGNLDGGRGVVLLLPFLLGFSTTLVMTVLNRMIAGVETVFGIDHVGQAKRMPRPINPLPHFREEVGVPDQGAVLQTHETSTHLPVQRNATTGTAEIGATSPKSGSI